MVSEFIRESRLRICRKCPLYIDSEGGICNENLYFSPSKQELSYIPLPGFISGCGCKLKLKTKFESEKCSLGKW